jgi:hypothetical protein
MSLEELRSLAPCQFFAMVDRLKALDRPRNGTIELMCAQLIAMVGNTGFREFKNPVDPKDFRPSLLVKHSHGGGRPKRRRNRQAIADEYRSVMNSLPSRS